jgi:hypothetical protein
MSKLVRRHSLVLDDGVKVQMKSKAQKGKYFEMESFELHLIPL